MCGSGEILSLQEQHTFSIFSKCNFSKIRKSFSNLPRNARRYIAHFFDIDFIQKLRKWGDSNSRYSFPYAAFRERCLQPLSHTSKNGLYRNKFCIFNKICYIFSVFIWPYRLTVRTPAFQAVNPGSIPGRVTNAC